MTNAVLDGATVAIARQADILNRIMAPDIHLALWQRRRPASLSWVDGLAWNRIENLDFTVAIDLPDLEVAEALAEAGYPQGGRGEALRAEITGLATRFAAILGCDHVTIRLDVIESDACRKFHADMVTARLITTISGPGTDWLEVSAADCIRRMATGEVAIFKGRLWAQELAVLHRSPPIAGTGDTRLLLVVQPFDPSREERARH